MWFILSIVVTALIYYVAIKPLKYWKERGVPCVGGWPIVGSIGATVMRMRPFPYVLEDIYRSYPEQRYVGFFNMTKPKLMIRDPDLIKKITVKEFDTFRDHDPLLPEDVDPLWNKNLFAMRGGERWQDMRSTLSPAFTSSKMRMMFELMKDCSKQLSDHFVKQGGMVTVEMKDVYTRFSNDVIATTAFGVTCDSLEHRENEFYLMGKEATTFKPLQILLLTIQLACRPLGKLLGVTAFTKAVSRFFRGLIVETLTIRKEQGIVRPDMIHLLMEARKGNLKHEDHTNNVPDSGFAVAKESEIGKTQKRMKTEITDEDITAQALIFFFAGFDSVSTAMSFCSYELAINPDVQGKLRKEIDEALEKSKGEITYEVILGMKYLDMVVTETLRKWPSFVFFDRKCVKAITIESDKPGENPLYLEEGSVCVMPIQAIQMDPKHYPNPHKFDPERFSDENKHQVNPFAYLPFGAGPRNCIGSRFALLEAKLVTVEILRKFEIVPVEKTPIPVRYDTNGFIPGIQGGFWLGLKPRTDIL